LAGAGIGMLSVALVYRLPFLRRFSLKPSRKAQITGLPLIRHNTYGWAFSVNF